MRQPIAFLLVLLLAFALVAADPAPVPAEASTVDYYIDLTSKTCALNQQVKYSIYTTAGPYFVAKIVGQYWYNMGTWHSRAWYSIPASHSVKAIYTGMYKTSTNSYAIIRNGTGYQTSVTCVPR